MGSCQCTLMGIMQPSVASVMLSSSYSLRQRDRQMASGTGGLAGQGSNGHQPSGVEQEWVQFLCMHSPVERGL